MKNAIELIEILRAQGVELYLAGDSIRFRGADGVLTPEIKDRMKEHRTEILAYLRQQIIQWAEDGIKRASIHVPGKVHEPVIRCLRDCGFLFEGVSTCCEASEAYAVRLCKHFLYREIHHSGVLDFLRQMLTGMGYEIRNEDEGF